MTVRQTSFSLYLIIISVIAQRVWSLNNSFSVCRVAPFVLKQAPTLSRRGSNPMTEATNFIYNHRNHSNRKKNERHEQVHLQSRIDLVNKFILFQLFHLLWSRLSILNSQHLFSCAGATSTTGEEGEIKEESSGNCVA